MPDRFEREINEILNNLDGFPKGGARRRRNGNDAGRRFSAMLRTVAARLSRISVGQVMLTALALMVVSFLFHGIIGPIWKYGLTLGLILFFTAFLLSFRGGSVGRSSEPYFRGRPRSHYESGGPSFADRLRVWWRQRRPRR